MGGLQVSRQVTVPLPLVRVLCMADSAFILEDLARVKFSTEEDDHSVTTQDISESRTSCINSNVLCLLHAS